MIYFPAWLDIFILCVIVSLGSLKQIQLGTTLLVAAAVLGLMGGLGPAGLWGALFSTLTSSVTLTLILSVILLGLFNSLMKETGLLEKFMSGLYTMIADRRLIASILAMLVGLMPILGGAVFSAPLVEEASADLKLQPERKAAINVFFRHIIYLLYPLYPAMIITVELTGLNLGRVLLNNVPAAMIALFLSLVLMFKGTGPFRISIKPDAGALLAILPVSLSMLLMILLAVWANLYFPLAILAGLAAAFASFILYPGNIVKAKNGMFFKNIMRDGFQYRVLMAILGIMFLQEVLKGTGVLEESLGQLLGSGIPLYLLAITAPLMVSLLTGDNTAAMGILLPTFLVLDGFGGPGIYSFVALMYVSAFLGNVISPVHICLSLTKEFFQAELGKIYRYLAPPLFAALLATIFLVMLKQGLF